MKRIIFHLIIFPMVIASCNTSQKAPYSQVSPESASGQHSAQNSLDWIGTYSGIVPCASCEGIETELRLGKDMTYSLTVKYLGKQEEPYSMHGKFEWKGNNIKLGGIAGNDRADVYKVEENRLRQLDMDGNIITGELESNYILTKDGNPQVENKKWVLTELRGKPVNENPETHYLIFHAENNRLEAKAGCNVLLNTYKIQSDVRLTVIPGISTLMACPEGSLEPDLIEVLKMVDNISANEGELSLNKARMAPLARFRLNKPNN